MRLIKASYNILTEINGEEFLKNLEIYGRNCYQSEDKITKDSYKVFIKNLIEKKHESVLEHEKITVRLITDIGVLKEITRHRLASYSVESTRYCCYNKNKFDNQLTFIIPEWINIEAGEYTKNDLQKLFYKLEANDYDWFEYLLYSERLYIKFSNNGWIAEKCRSILPHSTKTEIIITANLREWRTIFKQRVSKTAHPQMIELMSPLLEEFKEKIPIVFDDILIN